MPSDEAVQVRFYSARLSHWPMLLFVFKVAGKVINLYVPIYV